MRLELDRTLKILFTVILVAVIGYFVWQVVQRVLYPIQLFVMASIVAFILSPGVDWLHESGFPRPLAILTVYIALLIAVVGLGYWLISPLLEQVTNLVNSLPKRANEFQTYVNRLHVDQFLAKYKLGSTNDLKNQAVDYAKGLSTSLFANLSTVVLTSFNVLVNVVLVLVIAFYLLMDGEQLKDRLFTLVPDSQRSRVAFVEATVNEVLGGYLRGQLLMALTIGTLAGVGTAILGLGQYSVLIGVLAGILELVPMLGPWLASMPAIVLSLFQPHPFPLALEVALYFLAIQQLESNVIGPRITGHAVGLHPLAALMALLVGIEVYGMVGALFAVPVAGILWVLGMALYYYFTGRERPIEPVRRVPTTPLFGVVNWHPVRTAVPDSFRKRIANVRLRRGDGGEVPERLVVMERKGAALQARREQRHAGAEFRPPGRQDDAAPAPDSTLDAPSAPAHADEGAPDPAEATRPEEAAAVR